MKKLNPTYHDLYPYATYQGSVNYRGSHYRFIYSSNGGNRSLFVFDPKGEGMTLTNAADYVLENVFNQLLNSQMLNGTTFTDFMNLGVILLKDSLDEWSRVQVESVLNTNIHRMPVVLGVRVKRWEIFKFTPEFFELFKLLG